MDVGTGVGGDEGIDVASPQIESSAVDDSKPATISLSSENKGKAVIP